MSNDKDIRSLQNKIKHTKHQIELHTAHLETLRAELALLTPGVYDVENKRQY